MRSTIVREVDGQTIGWVFGHVTKWHAGCGHIVEWIGLPIVTGLPNPNVEKDKGDAPL